MRVAEMEKEIGKLLKSWEKTHAIPAPDQFAKYQITSDILILILKVLSNASDKNTN
tara:strand:+ start:149 stop:316 length:168 start_codon:yes stop_codon:yes gene_type:complete